jgi:DNA-binding NtrC family response regulator
MKRFSAAAETALLAYEWPGNVRALRHAIERAVILSAGDVLEASDMQLNQAAPLPADRHDGGQLRLEQVEKETISAALQKHGFNISRAAKELGLTRASLYRRMDKHGL